MSPGAAHCSVDVHRVLRALCRPDRRGHSGGAGRADARWDHGGAAHHCCQRRGSRSRSRCSTRKRKRAGTSLLPKGSAGQLTLEPRVCLRSRRKSSRRNFTTHEGILSFVGLSPRGDPFRQQAGHNSLGSREAQRQVCAGHGRNSCTACHHEQTTPGARASKLFGWPSAACCLTSGVSLTLAVGLDQCHARGASCVRAVCNGANGMHNLRFLTNPRRSARPAPVLPAAGSPQGKAHEQLAGEEPRFEEKP